MFEANVKEPRHEISQIPQPFAVHLDMLLRTQRHHLAGRIRGEQYQGGVAHATVSVRSMLA